MNQYCEIFRSFLHLHLRIISHQKMRIFLIDFEETEKHSLSVVVYGTDILVYLDDFRTLELSLMFYIVYIHF